MTRKSSDPCQIEGCEKPRSCRGWCEMHYARWRAHGDPLALRPNATAAITRFMSKVHIEPSGCWRWTPGPAHVFGYGNFWLDGKTVSAHRASYLLHKGPIPDGLALDHLCRTPICVNPDHLEPVTQRENLLRGATFQARNASKTHCVNGHEFTSENTNLTGGYRRCRACYRASYQRRKAAA